MTDTKLTDMTSHTIIGRMSEPVTSPTVGLRFVNRVIDHGNGKFTDRYVLQQLWVTEYNGAQSTIEWRDVPVEEE